MIVLEMYKTRILGIILSLLTIISIGCGNKNDKEDDVRAHNLATIDSLMGARGEGVLAMINNGMRTAKDSMTWNEFYVRKAKYFSLSSTPDSLTAIIDHVENFAKTKTNTERGRQLLAFAYNCRAALYHNFHRNTSETIDLYRNAYALLMQSEDKSQTPNVAANLGDAYDFENNLPKAAMWYRRSLFLVDSLDLPEKDNVTLYLGFARICQELGDNETALYYYKQTAHHFDKLEVSMKAYYLNNFGNYYYYQHEYKEALSKFIDLRKLLEHNGMQNNFDMFLCKVNLADVYLNLDSLQEAKKYLDDVKPFAMKNGDPAMIYYCRTIYIGIAVKEKKWDEVRKLVANEKWNNGVPFQLRQIRNRYMTDYYTTTGNYKQAYTDLVADRAFNDSLEHKRINMRTADIMTQFTTDTLRLHTDLALEQQQAENDKARFVAVIAIILAVTFILLFILVRVHSRKHFSETLLKIMDLRLINARNRFSPHFVFNVLNNYIISTNEDERGVLMKLSKLLRSGLDRSRQMLVSLDDELNYVKDYVYLEKPMVGDDFDFQVHVADDVKPENVMVPSMLIQLMVENALVHGLKGWNGHKKLSIDLTNSPRGIVVSVTDNGPGFNFAAMRTKKGHGLDIIRQTIAVFNSRNKKKMIFNITNIKNPDGKVGGCQMSLTVPDNLKELKYNKF